MSCLVACVALDRLGKCYGHVACTAGLTLSVQLQCNVDAVLATPATMPAPHASYAACVTLIAASIDEISWMPVRGGNKHGSCLARPLTICDLIPTCDPVKRISYAHAHHRYYCVQLATLSSLGSHRLPSTGRCYPYARHPSS